MTKEERREYDHQYRIDNAEKLKEYARQYCIDNAEKIKEQKRQYRIDNAEKEKERGRQYCIDNAEKLKERGRQYRIDNAEKIKERNRQWRIDNAEKEKERGRQYCIDNKEKIAQYRIDNAEKIKEYARQYCIDNPEIYRAACQRRLARKRQVASTLTPNEWQKILDDHFGRCHYCGVESDMLHQEHKTPLSKGGGYTKENIVPACKSCNSSKGVSDYKVFVKQGQQRLQLELGLTDMV